VAVASLGQPTVFPTAREGSLVAFEDTRAWWFDGVPADTPHELDALRTHAASLRSVAWPELVELRINASADARALQAVHRNGDRWSVPLHPSQVAAVQKALDVVDVRLRRELGKHLGSRARIVAAAVVFTALLTTSFGNSALLLVLIPALLVVQRPSIAALAALGAIAIASAVSGVADGPGELSRTYHTLALLALAVTGTVALSMAWRARQSNAPAGTRLTLLVLGAMGAIAALAATPALVAGSLIGAPGLSALAVTLLGMAAAVLVVEPQRRRLPGGALAAAGFILGVAPTLSMSAGTSTLSRSAVTATEIRSFPLGQAATMLRLSPNGTYFLVQRYDVRGAPRSGSTGTFVVGDTTRVYRSIDAWSVEFADDAHILAIRPAEGRLALSLERVDSATVVWRAPIPDLYEPTLTVMSSTGRWMITGEEVASDSFLVATGTFATPSSSVHRFPPLDSIGTFMEPLIFDDGARLVIAGYSTMGQGRSRLSILLGAFMLRTEMEMWEISDTGRRHIGTLTGYPQCAQPEGDRAICFVRDRSGAAVWEVGPNGVRLTPTRVRTKDLVTMSVGPGPRVTAPNGEGRILYVDLDARRMIEIQLPSGTSGASEARVAGNALAALTWEADGVHLAWYRLEAEHESSAPGTTRAQP
ncbi:MAG TPA: hypothetical protein VF178_03915, partial [Gemmatimonadaceae bacterium]